MVTKGVLLIGIVLMCFSIQIYCVMFSRTCDCVSPLMHITSLHEKYLNTLIT